MPAHGSTLSDSPGLKKKRLDSLLTAREIAPDLDTARRLIGAGEVYVNDMISDKAGSMVPETAAIRLKQHCPFVSRGGFKLAQGIEAFAVSVEHRICLDVGASTGGFTDCLLQHGAAKVYAVDVAYGQLAWKLRQDERVSVIERCNARHLTPEQLGEAVDLAVTDVSFISLTRILPPMVAAFQDRPVNIIALIKPQFELPRDNIGEGGIVRDPALHNKAKQKIVDFTRNFTTPPLRVNGIVESPIKGPKGNTEFLIHIIS